MRISGNNNIRLVQNTTLVPQSEVSLLAGICRQNVKDVLEILSRKKKDITDIRDENHIMHSHYARFQKKDIAEMIHEDDRTIDYLLNYSGMTPREYLQNFPEETKKT